MTAPNITFSADEVASIGGDVLVLGALQSADGPTLFASGSFPQLQAQLALVGFSAKADELVRLPAIEGSATSVAIIGLGKDATANAIRSAAGSEVRQLAGNATLVFGFAVASDDDVLALVESATLGAYSFTRPPGQDQGRAEGPGRLCGGRDLDSALCGRPEQVSILGDGVALVKDLVNTPGAQLYPASFGERATEAATGIPNLSVEVWDE